jgi:hypothetical protein
MKKIIHSILLCLTALLLAPGSTKAQGLSFSISFNKTVYTLGEPIVCTMTLKNTGSTALVVNNRFLVNRASGPHEVAFQVIDPVLLAVPFSSFVNSKSESDQYRALPSGASETVTYILTNHYTLTKLGKYSVVGFYENKADPPVSLSLPTAWKGRLKSNKALFTLN